MELSKSNRGISTPLFPLILVLVAIIGVIGLTAIFSNKDAPSKKSPDISRSDQPEAPEDSIESRKATWEQVMGFCANLPGDYRDKCFTRYALQTHDAYLCKVAQNFTLVEPCLQAVRCYSVKPYHESLVQNCILDRVNSLNMSILCLALNDESIQRECVFHVVRTLRDKGQCEYFEGELRDGCYRLLLPSSSPVDCTRLVPAQVRDDCLYDRAIEQNSSVYCAHIENFKAKAKCLELTS